MKTSTIYPLCVIAIILTSCGTPSPGIVQPSEIHDPKMGTPYTEISTQEMRTDNCDGANPTNTVTRSLAQEQTTLFEVLVEAGGLVRGTAVPGMLEAELEAKIKTALRKSAGNTDTQTISVVLATPSGQALIHRISWNEKKVKGVIDVDYQDGTAKINFEKVIGIELAGRTSEPQDCSGQELPIPTLSGNVTVLPSLTESNGVSSQPQIAVQLPNDLSCRQHSSGYCGLEMKVLWSKIENISDGYYIYTIGHGLYYQPELWWVAGNGVPISTPSGDGVINDGAYGNRGDSLGVFACLTKTRYTFNGTNEILFREKPACEIYSTEVYFQPR